ncbi:unnamed protein product [Psylliodes chrysocephalus]|uniref:Nucleic-acid-binding protein from transposon X-element n=1 Tax=Psylliodes chrysocephalus TaxID=3402493 RepID=A0A9P0CRM0_9CUCU|nr:unnamed protein product [Psylliodes chrysocephala]
MYTSKADKTYAFVLRGMAKGTNINDIEDDLRDTYEIEAKETFLRTTKYGPLYLIVTDPAITLNKNVRVIENTRVTWELRRAVKAIIKRHRCQAWGHATTNCGRPLKCSKCAGNHLTNTCAKTRETPATCANCRGEHPANYTKCEAYLERVARLEERRQAHKPKVKYVQTLPPARNAWDKNRNPTSRELRDFPPLPNNNKDNPNPQIRRNNEDYNPQPGRMEDFLALNNEFQELNSMVNIAALTRAVRYLNSSLRKCTSTPQYFMTFNNFMTNFDSYNIRN